nr:MAG TPA: hypothetical protein [Caudoviricetes sp.]
MFFTNYLYGKSIHTIYKRAHYDGKTEFSYTGVSVTIPRNTLTILCINLVYANANPIEFTISTSDVELKSALNTSQYPRSSLSHICYDTDSDTTYYLWANHKNSGKNYFDIFQHYFTIK